MAAFEEFMVYKRRIPVRGAIMLNHDMDSVVLVKGWKKGAGWSFPRGKINKDEDDLICAIREVYEETGYDLEAAGLVPEDRDVKHITMSIRDQDMRLYVFRDVPRDTLFEPKTRKEISKIQWWRISDLPGFRKKGQQHPENTPNANKFYMVASFLRDLRKWIIDQKKSDARRIASSQYLSAAMSHDEFLTEEELGAESTNEPIHTKTSIDTLEGATAALRSLLKLQPPTQGLQTEAMRSPIARDSGPELLALLQGKGQPQSLAGPSNPPPQTPLDHTYTQAPEPKTPHHQQLRPPHFSSLPPPLSFSIQQPSTSFSYQDPTQHRHDLPNNALSFQQQREAQSNHPPFSGQGPPHYQSQHLVHPQPLPPHVQRAVFTGGPVHSPMMPQPIQQHSGPHIESHVSTNPSIPQFPGLHAPMIPVVQKQTPPKLTSHALALLDAFKVRDHTNGDAGASADLPLRRYVEVAKPKPPQELAAETPKAVPVDLLSLFKAQDSPNPSLNPTVASPRIPISEAHKTTLLDLFKSPTTQPAVPLRPAATALPISATPSAVELSAVEPVSVPSPNNGASASGVVRNRANIPELNPEANLPYRAMAILSRPPQVSSGPSPRPQKNGERSFEVPKKKSQQTRPARPGHKLERGEVAQAKTPEKRFQPQILKRPPQGISTTNEGPTSNPQTVGPLAPQLSAQAPSLLPIQPSFDSRSSQTIDQKQTLLSLFGKSQSPANPLPVTASLLTAFQPKDASMGASTRSRVESLALGEAVSRHPSQAPISPADKSFLLNYLDTVAKDAQH
jgi:mRNA-decapping enzyme subunit 2